MLRSFKIDRNTGHSSVLYILHLQVKQQRGKERDSQLRRREQRQCSLWRCGIETTKRTLECTTQLAVRDTTDVSGDRRLKPYANLLKYPRLNCNML